MKIGGMGHQAIRVEVHELRRLGEIPEEVRIIGTLPQWETRRGSNAWAPTSGPQPIYLYIKHRYCPRLGPNQVMMYDALDHFLRRFQESREQENNAAGEQVPEHLKQNGTWWVEDDVPNEEP